VTVVDWCVIAVVVVVGVLAASTYWTYSVPKEYKERNRRWKTVWK
jgi:hypothetical protein